MVRCRLRWVITPEVPCTSPARRFGSSTRIQDCPAHCRELPDPFRRPRRSCSRCARGLDLIDLARKCFHPPRTHCQFCLLLSRPACGGGPQGRPAGVADCSTVPRLRATGTCLSLRLSSAIPRRRLEDALIGRARPLTLWDDSPRVACHIRRFSLDS